MKKVNKFNSELNRFVNENCRKYIVVQDIDMFIRYYDDNDKCRAIESKHLNESIGKGQKITLIELTKHNIESFVVFGNPPYRKNNYIYSLHTFNLYKVDSNVLIKFFNNHIEEGGLTQYWVANNKNLHKLSDSVEIEPYNSYNQKITSNDLAGLVPTNDFNDGFPPMDADYFPSDSDFEANLPPDVTTSPVNENRTKRNYNDEFDEKDIVRILMLYGSQHFQIKQNGAIEEWNIANYVLSNTEEIIEEFIEEFNNPLYKRIVNMIYENLEEEKIYTLQDFLEHKDKKIQRLAVDLSMSPHEYIENWIGKLDKPLVTQPMPDDNFKTDAITGVNLFKLKKIQRLYEKNQKDLKNTSNENVQGMMRLLQVQQRLMDVRRSVAEQTGSIILK